MGRKKHIARSLSFVMMALVVHYAVLSATNSKSECIESAHVDLASSYKLNLTSSAVLISILLSLTRN
jgi:hypothetical protein